MQPLARLGECRMLATLFVVGLLVCHGAFGAIHLFCAPSGGAASVATSAVAVHATAHHEQEAGSGSGGTPAHHCTGGEYYAALLGVLLAFALLLVFSAQRRWEARKPGRRYEEVLPVSVPILPRGPTLLCLQVFRL